ncbi:hypothetical protein ACFOEE_10930 [Pseudoalteromonas fenneropenaei]|uniref:Uncharacterized protein n=1 Tax=Pseudoalteromonas fenneropenaei TaxID=1737459 RepID=A0ABV7CKD7_9GAMM
MMSLLKLSAAALFVSVFSLNAQSINKSVEMASQIKRNISSNSQLLGLSEETYKYANDQFLRLHFGTLDHNIPLISEIPEFISPENYSESELNEAMNIQKAKFASLLGLPVAKLDSFIEHMSVVYKSDLFSRKVVTSDAREVSDMESSR